MGWENMLCKKTRSGSANVNLRLRALAGDEISAHSFRQYYYSNVCDPHPKVLTSYDMKS